MTRIDLKEKFDEAASNIKQKDSSEEGSTLILRTPWVRILLDHYHENNTLSIEVEMSYPEDAGQSVSESSELIDRLQEHIRYLQRLKEVGFELSVIGTGCIYCASKELTGTPEDNLFRALIPPETE
ncbi:MAG: hypothetical protein ACFFEM_01900 [Candidatus Thorarchaeota archaeon]